MSDYQASDADHDFVINMLDGLIELITVQGIYTDASYQELQMAVWQKAQEARALAQQRGATKGEQEAFNQQVKNLAGALPKATQGILTAVKAFPDDPITGSAALMDICAAVTPLIAGLSAAGGPPGMIIGAIFSMVSQILSFFAPQAESLDSKLKNALANMRAEEKDEGIKSAQDDISVYTGAVRLAAIDADEVLNNAKLTGPAFASEIKAKVDVLNAVIKAQDSRASAALTTMWNTGHWLQKDANQSLTTWPTILAAWCRAYTDYRLTAALLSVISNTDGVRARFEQAEGLGDDDKEKVRDALQRLRTTAAARVTISEATNRVAAEHISALVGPARNRGLLWQVDPAGNYLYAGTDIRRGKFAYCDAAGKRIAIAASAKDMESATPTYHVFHLEPGANGRTYHGQWKHPYGSSPAWKELEDSLNGLTDIWATVGGGSSKSEIYFHGAKDNSIIGYVLDENDKVRDGNYRQTLKTKAISVRVVRNPSWFGDDPDAGAKGARLQKQPYITYGGCEANGDIFVDLLGREPGYVPSPWTQYIGLGVDNYYLWVFGTGGFACATHASVVRCLNKEIDKPRWMEHYPNDLLYDKSYLEHEKEVRGERPPLKGVMDLSPCEDGTLVASIAERFCINLNNLMWAIVDDAKPPIYTGTYQTDLQAQKIEVRWTKLPDATGVVVQKVPIACWSMLESLRSSLPAAGAKR